MKKSACVALGALIASLGLAFGAGTAMAQDLAALSPKSVKVLVNNDRVRILEVLDKPGETEPMHSHPDFVAVSLSSTKIKVTTPDGKVVEKDRKSGEALYSGPITHSISNVGTADFHMIVIELKK
jgi:quercetin dioxygenase-like cupin family protein